MKNWPIVARIAFCCVVGAVPGAALGGLYLRANPDSPVAVVFAVFTIVVGITPAVAAYLLIWPSSRILADQQRAEGSVERSWMVEASSNAFWWLAALLMLADGVGGLIHLTWLSPLTTGHVLAAAILAYGVSYLLARRRDA